MSNEQLMVVLTTLTFLSLWLPNPRVWQLSYAVLFSVGLASSAITYTAILPMLALLLLLIHYRKEQRYSCVSGALALVLGLALGLHLVPGFNNYEYASDITLSTSAASFDIWFNWDKSMFGLFVIGLLLHGTLIRSRNEAWATLKAFLPIAVTGIFAIYTVGVLIGYSSFDWTPAAIFLPWALKNLIFTVLAEEVFFRGIVQRQLAKHLKGAHSGHIAMVVAGVLFGLAHFAGGVNYVFLSTMAGILYGYTYHLTGRIEAPIITHFLLNAGHFLIFTYPYSA